MNNKPRDTVAMGNRAWASAYGAAPVPEPNILAVNETNQTKEKMSKSKKSKGTKAAAPKQRKAKASTNGNPSRKSKKGISVERFPKLCGFSATAVARHLGVVEGVKFSHASAIMKANGINIPDRTLKVHLCLHTRPAAPLTKEQVKELMNSAPEPETEPAAA